MIGGKTEAEEVLVATDKSKISPVVALILYITSGGLVGTGSGLYTYKALEGRVAQLEGSVTSIASKTSSVESRQEAVRAEVFTHVTENKKGLDSVAATAHDILTEHKAMWRTISGIKDRCTKCESNIQMLDYMLNNQSTSKFQSRGDK